MSDSRGRSIGLGGDLRPYHVIAGGVEIAVRVVTRAGHVGIDGVVEESNGSCRYKIKITAPPVDGMANKALIVFLSKTLGLPRSKVRIVAGETSCLKRVLCEGEAVDLISRLDALFTNCPN